MSYLVSKIVRWKVKHTSVGKIKGYKNHRVKYEGYKNLSPISHDCNISRIPNKFLKTCYPFSRKKEF